MNWQTLDCWLRWSCQGLMVAVILASCCGCPPPDPPLVEASKRVVVVDEWVDAGLSMYLLQDTHTGREYLFVYKNTEGAVAIELKPTAEAEVP